MNVRNSNSSSRSSNAILWIVVAGLAIIAGGFLIATLTPVILPEAASAQAVQVDQLFRFMLVIAGAIFLLVQGALQSMGRNPDAAPLIQTNMILGIVFTEAIAIYALVVALVILFVL